MPRPWYCKQAAKIHHQSQHYSVQGVVCTTSKRSNLIQNGEKFTIPTMMSEVDNTGNQHKPGSATKKVKKASDGDACKSVQMGKVHIA